MSNSLPTIFIDDEHETKDQKRKRLAIEFRAIHQQFNSKLLEILDTGVDVKICLRDTTLVDDEALIGMCDISYQTKPKHY